MATQPLPASIQGAARLLLEELQETGLKEFPQGAQPTKEIQPAPALDCAHGDLNTRIQNCQACSLAQTRTHPVPGEGPLPARIMFVGEAPGADEDRSGRPFFGRAGQLLTKIIEGGMGLKRTDIFITNTLKCRPPENRDPLAEEKSACIGFLHEQIKSVSPELIIALGRHAACTLLEIDSPLSQLRGQVHPNPQGGPPILATYHPAYLLRNPSAKKDCWADIQIGMVHLGLPIQN